MNPPEDFVAARGYLEVARGDCEKTFYLSACLTAQKAAEVALQSYLGSRGMDAQAGSLPALLASVPGRTPALEAACLRLERFRMDLISPYRSAPGPEPDATLEAARDCCAAAKEVVAYVERLFRELDGDELEDGKGGRT